MEWIDRNTLSNDLVFILIVLVLLLIGVLRQSEGQRLSVFVRAFVNTSLLDQQIRQERAFNRIAIPVFFLIIIILSAFLSLASLQVGLFDDASFTYLFSTIGSGLLALTLLRGIAYTVLAELFKLRKLLQAHSTQWLLNNFILALLVLPMSILLSYGPASIAPIMSLLGIILFGLFYLIRSIRLFSLIQEQLHGSLVYNVLYLCALEIMPPLLIAVAIWRQAV